MQSVQLLVNRKLISVPGTGLISFLKQDFKMYAITLSKEKDDKNFCIDAS